MGQNFSNIVCMMYILSSTAVWNMKLSVPVQYFAKSFSNSLHIPYRLHNGGLGFYNGGIGLQDYTEVTFMLQYSNHLT